MLTVLTVSSAVVLLTRPRASAGKSAPVAADLRAWIFGPCRRTETYSRMSITNRRRRSEALSVHMGRPAMSDTHNWRDEVCFDDALNSGSAVSRVGAEVARLDKSGGDADRMIRWQRAGDKTCLPQDEFAWFDAPDLDAVPPILQQSRALS